MFQIPQAMSHIVDKCLATAIGWSVQTSRSECIHAIFIVILVAKFLKWGNVR